MKKKSFIASLVAAVTLGLGISAKGISSNEFQGDDDTQEVRVAVVESGSSYYHKLRKMGNKWYDDERDLVLDMIYSLFKRGLTSKEIFTEFKVNDTRTRLSEDEKKVLFKFILEYNTEKFSIEPPKYKVIYDLGLDFCQYFIEEHRNKLNLEISSSRKRKSSFYNEVSEKRFHFYKKIKTCIELLLDLHKKNYRKLKGSEITMYNNFNLVTTKYIEYHYIETRKIELWNYLNSLNMDDFKENEDIWIRVPNQGKEVLEDGKLRINFSKINHSLTTITVPHALKRDLPFRLVFSTALGESNYGGKNDSSVGAQGIFQIKPGPYRDRMGESIPSKSNSDWNFKTIDAGIRQLEWIAKDLVNTSVNQYSKVPIFSDFSELSDSNKKIVFEIILINSIYHSGIKGDFNNPETLQYIRIMLSSFKYGYTFENTMRIDINSVNYIENMVVF